MGYALFFITTPMDQAIVESESCSEIDIYERYLRRTAQALQAGRAISAETVDQFMGYIQQLTERPAQFREYYKCGGN